MQLDWEHVRALVARAGLPTHFRWSDLPGGGNNCVYRLDCGDRAVLLKVYFRDPSDTRDRLGAEFSFLTFAWNAGVRKIPQPLARDDQFGFGLYEFLEGRPLRNGDVDASAVEQGVAFFREVNRQKATPAAQLLRPGSEACFTMAQHLDCVDRRMKRFDQLDRTTATGQEADRLVHERLISAWDRIRAEVVAGGVPMDEPLLPGDRCLSPSDFGFHNTIATPGPADSPYAPSFPSPGTPAFGSEAQARGGEGQGGEHAMSQPIKGTGGIGDCKMQNANGKLEEEGHGSLSSICNLNFAIGNPQFPPRPGMSDSEELRKPDSTLPPPQPSPGVPGEGERGAIASPDVSPGALRTPGASDQLKFIDFEYSGWDDPAKTVCDFFCQPDVTVPMKFFDRVSRAFVEDSSDPEFHLRRIALLLPVYRVKWCCIMLNEFLPVGSRRRSFAKDPASQEQRRATQLQKVRRALDAIQ